MRHSDTLEKSDPEFLAPAGFSRHDRRAFLAALGGLAVVCAGVPAAAQAPAADSAGAWIAARRQRRNECLKVRLRSMHSLRKAPWLSHKNNGDEGLYADKIASFFKGLPQNALGEADLPSYQRLFRACQSGRTALFESVPMAGALRLAHPQGAFTFGLEGYDSHQMPIAPAPRFDSTEEAAEMTELYWHALTRETPYSEFDGHPLIQAAAAELSSLSGYKGPRLGGVVTPGTIFRGGLPGDLSGPLVSQFLYKDIPYGALKIAQKYVTTLPGDDHMIDYGEWLHIQRGGAPAAKNRFDPVARYLRNQRDLGEYVHRDFTYNAFLNAALILLGMKAPFDSGNPYRNSASQSGFACFGGPHILDLVARAATSALKAAWFHKWVVHSRLRPETFAGRIHNMVEGRASYPIHADVLRSQALAQTFAVQGTYLLSQCYPEGCPCHPAYPAGHATIAGACTTVLKAFFDESFEIPEPVTASPDGLALVPYKGPALSAAGELNKLASNIALGRDMAGVHWRTDGIDGIKLGEAVAIGLLSDLRATYTEEFFGFRLTKFDGSVVRV